MITLKFGGTSMGSARRIINSAEIIIGRACKERVSVIVSAVAGVSNGLQESIDTCMTEDSSEKFTLTLRETHAKICDEIQAVLEGFDKSSVMAKIDALLAEYKKLLQGVTAFGECPRTIYCRIMGMGELMSSPIMEEVLRAKSQDVKLLDSRKFIITGGEQAEGDPDYKATFAAFESYRDNEDKKQKLSFNRNGINYFLTSCDLVGNKLIEII